MDETGFAQKTKKKVIAVHGSKTVRSKSVEASFYLTITACIAAINFVVPPLFVVPGQRLNQDVMNKCKVPKSTVSVANKGFMYSNLFVKWLEPFKKMFQVQ